MQITPFLMFEGRAEEAMNFYVSVFPQSRVISIDRYTDDELAPVGSVMRAAFTLSGQTIFCTDSPDELDFKFTPSSSLFVDCITDREVEDVFAKLSEGGEILMPLKNYGFSQKFGWVNDRFGVSWQLNLPTVAKKIGDRERPPNFFLGKVRQQNRVRFMPLG